MTQSLNEILATDPARTLLYGVNGSAKTTTVAMATLYEEFAPMYVFDWDLRIGGLRAALPSKCWELIKSDPYRDAAIPGEAFILMESMIEKINPTEYKSWCIDSLTSMMEGIMARVMVIDGKPVNSVPQLKHYMERQSILKSLIPRMCSKPLHFFVTCHEDTAKDEVTGRLFKTLDLDPKLINRIPNYFNEIWHTEVQQTSGQPPQYQIRTRSDMVYAARTSYKSLDTLERQDLIWSKIVAERKPRSA